MKFAIALGLVGAIAVLVAGSFAPSPQPAEAQGPLGQLGQQPEFVAPAITAVEWETETIQGMGTNVKWPKTLVVRGTGPRDRDVTIFQCTSGGKYGNQQGSLDRRGGGRTNAQGEFTIRIPAGPKSSQTTLDQMTTSWFRVPSRDHLLAEIDDEPAPVKTPPAKFDFWNGGPSPAIAAPTVDLVEWVTIQGQQQLRVKGTGTMGGKSVQLRLGKANGDFQKLHGTEGDVNPYDPDLRYVVLIPRAEVATATGQLLFTQVKACLKGSFKPVCSGGAGIDPVP